MSSQSQPHELELIIDADGKLHVTVRGVDGPACGDLTKWIEQLGTVEVDSPTADYRKLPKQTIRTGK